MAVAKGNVNQHVCILRPDQQRCNSKFLNGLLLSPIGQKQIDSFQAGGNRQGLNFSQIRAIRIPLPSTLAEQEAIAGALSDADVWIESLEQLIAKKRQIKQGAMQELLTGKRRLPGFSGVWEVSTVGREFEIKLGKMLDAEKNFGVSKPFIGNRAVQWERIDINDLATVPMSRSDIDRFRLRKGDLLVCEGGEVGRAAIWDAPISECYYQKALHRLRPVRGFSSRLMVGLLRLWSDRGVFSNFVTQTSIAHLPREKFMEMPLLVPTPPEQIAIAEVLAEIDAGIRALESKLAKASEIKQGMMQELLTGKIRLIEN
jgi:type I restriction enzyme S subunit